MMNVIVTDSQLQKTRYWSLSRRRIVLMLAAAVLLVVGLSVWATQWLMMHALRERWPAMQTFAEQALSDELSERERASRDSMDAMARRVGEMQARIVQLENIGERIAKLAGVKFADQEAKVPKGNRGGPLIEPRSITVAELLGEVQSMDERVTSDVNRLSGLESRLLDLRVSSLMLPTFRPVESAGFGSGFGRRIDPFTGDWAQHRGLDFPAEVGTPILAAAGGVVVTSAFHPEYGNVVEIDHGGGRVTRYGHTSRVWVSVGDLVKRGQHIADVGTSGRSTGPHLHFEVLVDGVQRNPKLFLDKRKGDLLHLARNPLDQKPL